jgi:O-antigen/teichoic acid export membrane protein
MGNTLGDRVVMVPMFAFATAATPLLVTAFERGGQGDVERLMRAYTRIVLLVGLPCIAYVAAVGSDLVTLITGWQYVEYAPAATVAPIVAIGSLLFALAGMANTGLAVAKQMKYLVLSSGIGLAVNVLANLVLIPPMGVKGAAIATPISMAAYLLATYHWARRYATWHVPFGTLLRASTAAGVAYVCAATVSVGSSRLMHVLLAAAVGLLVYLAALLALGERRRGQAGAAAA